MKKRALLISTFVVLLLAIYYGSGIGKLPCNHDFVKAEVVIKELKLGAKAATSITVTDAADVQRLVTYFPELGQRITWFGIGYGYMPHVSIRFIRRGGTDKEVKCSFDVWDDGLGAKLVEPGLKECVDRLLVKYGSEGGPNIRAAGLPALTTK